MLRQPLLYLSLFLIKHRSAYYELLDRVRRDGDWEAWLSFFFEGVEETANGAVASAEALSQLFAGDRARIERLGRRSHSVLRVHEALKGRPISTLAAICRDSGLSFPTVSAAVELLASKKIVREITKKRRNRLFAYQKFLDILNEER